MSDDAIEIVRDDMNRLRGRLFEAIESFGLNERHERACKAVIRRSSYDTQASLEAALRTSSTTETVGA